MEAVRARLSSRNHILALPALLCCASFSPANRGILLKEGDLISVLFGRAAHAGGAVNIKLVSDHRFRVRRPVKVLMTTKLELLSKEDTSEEPAEIDWVHGRFPGPRQWV